MSAGEKDPLNQSDLRNEDLPHTSHLAPRTLAEKRRQKWLARLGQPVSLDYPFFAIGDVYRRAPSRTVATGELCTGRIAAGDALECSGYAPAPTLVRVLRVDRPDSLSREVSEVAEGVDGDVLGLTLEHDAASEIVPGQCLAPPGKLRTISHVDAEVWIVTADDLPCVPEEQRALLDDLAAGRGLELFFHTRALPSQVHGAWRPELGEEYRLAFDLSSPVPVYDGARFGVRYRGLTIGVGFVIGMG